MKTWQKKPVRGRASARARRKRLNRSAIVRSAWIEAVRRGTVTSPAPSPLYSPIALRGFRDGKTRRESRRDEQIALQKRLGYREVPDAS